MTGEFWILCGLLMAMAVAGGIFGHAVGWDRGFSAAQRREGRRG